MDGKKLIVLSDSHGNVSPLIAALSWANDRMPPNDTVYGAVFIGDGISDLRPAAVTSGFYGEWFYVRGNNDYNYSIPESAAFDFEGSRFYLNHGHKHSLYDNFHTLTAAARNNRANVAIFGHTHVPFIKEINGILLINPGSIGRPRSKAGASFAVIECAAGELNVEFWGVSSNEEVFKLNIIE